MARKNKPPPVVPAPPPFVAVDFSALVGVIRETVREVMREQAPPPPQPEPESPAEWLTSREAAALLKLKPGTLEIWRMKGKGPRFCRIGRAVRYARADVNAYARDGR